MTQDRIPVLLDCDTGIDDSIALAYLLGSPEAELVGIATVSGNTDAAQAATNTLALLDLVGRDDIPVAVGTRDFLTEGYAGGSPHVHGANGIGGIELPAPSRSTHDLDAARFIIDAAHRHAGRLRIVAIGPLTNLARALELEPLLPEIVHSVTIMGGAVYVDGNVTERAEANIWHDPEAASRVLTAGWAVTLVPLDVTRQHGFTPADREALLADGRPLSTAIAGMLDTYLDFYENRSGIREAALHDPLAAALAIGAIIPATVREPGIEVALTGEERGWTRPVPWDPHVVVVTALDEPAAPSILRRVLAGAQVRA